MKGKILIVGETEDLLDPIAKILETDKYVVAKAYSLKEALKVVKDFGPHAIIHAIDVPGQKCIHLCKRLRKDGKTIDLPIILITRKETNKKYIIECLNKGATNTIFKPFNKKELLSKIKNHVKMGFLYADIKKDVKDMTVILDVTRSLSSSLSSKELFNIIVKKISEVINVARCSIVRIDPNSPYGTVIATHENPGVKDLKINLRRYPEIRKALQTRDMVVVTDVWNDPIMTGVKRYLEKIRFDSIMIIPLIYNEELIGSLVLRASRIGTSFTEKEIRFCKVVANVAATALYNAYLYEMINEEKTKLQKIAITDDLTGVYNHRYFSHRLQEEFNMVGRYDHPLSLIMLDIDHFKAINDTYGHKKGDMVLKEFARILKRNIRKVDILARYGGEEFVILLPQTDQKGALSEGERIRKILREHDYRIKDTRITVSVGIATYPYKGIKTPDDLLGCADKSLYIAKAKGRDSTALFQ